MKTRVHGRLLVDDVYVEQFCRVLELKYFPYGFETTPQRPLRRSIMMADTLGLAPNPIIVDEDEELQQCWQLIDTPMVLV